VIGTAIIPSWQEQRSPLIAIAERVGMEEGLLLTRRSRNPRRPLTGSNVEPRRARRRTGTVRPVAPDRGPARS